MSIIAADTIKSRVAGAAVTTTNGLNVGGATTVAGAVVATSFAGDGSSITALSGSNISSGTVAAARVATLNQDTTGTAALAEGLTGTPNITVGNISAAGGDLTIRNITGVAATFTGVLTYEDVTNIDSVGVITARSGIEFGVSGAGGTITSAGAATFTGELKTDTRVRFNTAGTRSNANTVIDIYDENGQPGTSSIALTAGGDATFAGTVTDTSGNLRITPISAKTGDYTLVATDSGKTITRTGGNITVPQSMTAGMVVTIINDHSSTMSIIKGTGVTLRSTDGSDATKTLAAYGVATVLYISASSAYLTGSGLS